MSSGNESCSSTSDNPAEGRQPKRKTIKNSYKYGFERVFSPSLNWHSAAKVGGGCHHFYFEDMKRKDYISWNDYFMGVAFLAALRSKDPRRQVGACIVSEDNKIVGVGYNGMPGGRDDDFPWAKNEYSFLENKLTYVCHAEMNAFMNAVPKDTKNCNLYVTLFPCNECAKIIIQAKIREVIYKDYRKNIETEAAKRMFDKMKIKYSPFKPDTPKITITLNGSN